MAYAADAPRPDELDDVTLARARRGDERACRALVTTYERRVFARVGRMLGRGAAVEDAAQETFLRVFRALPGFEPNGPARLSTWILTIAARVSLDEIARRRPSEPLSPELPSTVRTDEKAEARALGRVVERAVAALPPPLRAVFLLREYHELEYDEIARALAIDLGTVKSRLSRARQALRAALAEVNA